MAELRTLLEDAGYGNVRTYIASGNVLLDGPAAREQPRRGARASRRGRLRRDDRGDPAQAARARRDRRGAPVRPNTSDTHVAFLASRPAKSAAARLEPVAAEAVLLGAELYLRLPRGVHGSRLSNARIESLLGVQATLRNWRTVVALAELAAQA